MFEVSSGVQICAVETGGSRNTRRKRRLAIVQEYRLLKLLAIVVGEHEGSSQIQRRVVEHGIGGRLRVIVACQKFPRGLWFRQASAVPAAPPLPTSARMPDLPPRPHGRVMTRCCQAPCCEFLNGKVLIGKSVRQFMNQGNIAHVHGGPVGDEKLLPLEIVKGGGLFGEKIDRGLFQIEIGRNKAEFLQSVVSSRADFIGLHRPPDLLFEVIVHLSRVIDANGIVCGCETRSYRKAP